MRNVFAKISSYDDCQRDNDSKCVSVEDNNKFWHLSKNIQLKCSKAKQNKKEN